MNKKMVTIIIPVVLILLIVGIAGIAAAITKNRSGKSEDEIGQLQDSIMDYADGQREMPPDESGERSPDVTGTDLSGMDGKISGETGEADATSQPGGTPVPTKTPVPGVPEILYQGVEYDPPSQLGEMMHYWADNNQKALSDLVFLDHNKAMSYSLIGTDDYYYYGDEDASGRPDGTGIAVYGDNFYYYGSWSGGKRNGEGSLLHYHIYEFAGSKDVCSYHTYIGGWKNDLPEGDGAEHYEYHQHLLQKGIGYNSNLIGTYKAGLYHGNFYITNLYSDNNVKEWDATAQNGVFEYRNTNLDTRGRRTVQVDRADRNNYIWMHPDDNKDHGVSCLNVSGKRRYS